ncbi:MAG TPA: TolC family protein [Candidatus Omnitrophica bacterium]|nr:TolC family protein [Candidatus Omnitrophota bacterium]
MFSKKIVYFAIIISLLFLPAYVLASEPQEGTIVLTEKEAIEIALKNNYDILSKKEEISQASARLQQAWSQVFPYISVGANYTRYQDHPFITYEDNRGYSFSVNQILFSGGRVANTIVAAHKALKATRESRDELENKIIYNTKQAFYAVLLAKELVRIRKETLELAEENLSITKERYKKGEASHYDLLRSKVEVANIKPQLIKAENFLKTSLNYLKVLLGIDPSQKIRVKGEFKYTPEEVDLNKELGFALERRPALKEISLQEEAAKAQVRAAFAGYLPQVNLNFTDFANQKESFSAGREKYDDYWVAAISVSMPIFDGFLTYAKVKEAKAKQRELSILRKKLKDSVKVEVENAVLDLEAAKSSVESQKENVKRAKEAYQIIKHRYALGQASQLDLLDARVALSTAQVNLAQSLYDFVVAKAKLRYVVGKGEE